MQRYHTILVTNLRKMWTTRRYLSTKVTRIGCASGFWGDSAVAGSKIYYRSVNYTSCQLFSLLLLLSHLLLSVNGLLF